MHHCDLCVSEMLFAVPELQGRSDTFHVTERHTDASHRLYTLLSLSTVSFPPIVRLCVFPCAHTPLPPSTTTLTPQLADICVTLPHIHSLETTPPRSLCPTMALSSRLKLWEQKGSAELLHAALIGHLIFDLDCICVLCSRTSH